MNGCNQKDFRFQTVFLSTALLGLLCGAHAGRALAAPAVSAGAVNLPPGTWARYAMIMRGKGERSLIRLAALERVDKAQWFEISLTQPGKGRTIFRSLVVQTNGRWQVKRSIMQLPGQRALELPAATGAHQVGLLTRQTQPPKGGRVVSVKVPAGRFRARLLVKQGPKGATKSWFARRAAWPLVRFESSDTLMVLVAFGKGARSELIGKAARIHRSIFGQDKKAAPRQAPAKGAPR
jgi:hypothetical protein